MLIIAGSQDPELSNRLGLRTLSWNHNSALFHILFVLLSSAQAGCVFVTLRFSPHGHHSNPGSQKTTATMLSITFNPRVLQLACSNNPALVWKIGTHIQVAIKQKSNESPPNIIELSLTQTFTFLPLKITKWVLLYCSHPGQHISGTILHLAYRQSREMGARSHYALIGWEDYYRWMAAQNKAPRMQFFLTTSAQCLSHRRHNSEFWFTMSFLW